MLETFGRGTPEHVIIAKSLIQDVIPVINWWPRGPNILCFPNKVVVAPVVVAASSVLGLGLGLGIVAHETAKTLQTKGDKDFL